MATPKWQDYMAGSVQAPALELNMRLLSALATLASGQNPDGTGFSLPTTQPATPTNVLDGFQAVTATTGATTLVTVPLGRTWVGTVSMNAGVTVAAASATAGNAQAILSLSGAGSTPAAGNYFQVNAVAGANAATGLVGSDGNDSLSSPFTVVAGANNVLIQSTITITGTSGFINISVIGELL